MKNDLAGETFDLKNQYRQIKYWAHKLRKHHRGRACPRVS